MTRSEREVELAEKSVERLHWWERRWADRWFRRFDRAALLVLVVMYFVAFHAIGKTQDQVTSNRLRSSQEICTRVNTNAQAINRVTAYLQGIIIGSVQGSRPFERFYKREGFPSYAERLAQARRLADGLGRLRVPQLDCSNLAVRIKDSVR